MKRFISERGQSLVELGVSLLILLYLLSGAAEFGVLFFQFVQLRDAAQEGALYGSMNPTNAVPIEDRVRAASSSPIDLTDVTKVTIAVTALDKTTNATKTLSSACEGDGLFVQVSFTHHIFMPFMPQLLGRSDIPLTADVTDTVLTPVCP